MNRRKFFGSIAALIGWCATTIGIKSKFAPLPIEDYRLTIFEYPDVKDDHLVDAFAELDEIEARSPEESKGFEIIYRQPPS